MEDVVEKELSFVEKIIVKVFRRTFIKVCNIIRISTVNKLLK